MIKKGVELPEMIKKNTCGIFRGPLFVYKFLRVVIFSFSGFDIVTLIYSPSCDDIRYSHALL